MKAVMAKAQELAEEILNRILKIRAGGQSAAD